VLTVSVLWADTNTSLVIARLDRETSKQPPGVLDCPVKPGTDMGS